VPCGEGDLLHGNHRLHGAGGTDGHAFAGGRIAREAIVSRTMSLSSLTRDWKDERRDS
jgi:hypothetical protein